MIFVKEEMARLSDVLLCMNMSNPVSITKNCNSIYMGKVGEVPASVYGKALVKTIKYVPNIRGYVVDVVYEDICTKR